MKITYIVYAALLAVASAQEAAAVPSDEELSSLPGTPFNKMKRAAEAVAEALAEPEAEARYRTHFCYRRGETCSKAKRDALALAEAVAEAHASANPEPEPEAKYKTHFCYRRGEACSKVKRAADAIAEAIAVPEPEAYRTHFCYRRGETCSKHKRALDELHTVVKDIQSKY